MLNPLLKYALEHLSGLAVHGLAGERVVQEAVIQDSEDLLVAAQRGTSCRGTGDDAYMNKKLMGLPSKGLSS
jgi:hypothetical protein